MYLFDCAQGTYHELLSEKGEFADFLVQYITEKGDKELDPQVRRNMKHQETTECVRDLDYNIAWWLFSSRFWPLLKKASFLEAAGAVVEISSCLRSSNRNQVKLAQIRETHCTMCIRDLDKLFNLKVFFRLKPMFAIPLAAQKNTAHF